MRPKLTQKKGPPLDVMSPKHKTSLGNPADGYLAGSEKDLNGVLWCVIGIEFADR